MLSSEDVATFEFETKLKVLFSIPSMDDRQNSFEPLNKFINNINL